MSLSSRIHVLLCITSAFRFLYALFLALDANFRLKRKDVSSEEKDPGLGTGWAFYCEIAAYMAHLAKHWDIPQEVRFCTNSRILVDH